MNERIEKLAIEANSHHDNFFDLNYKELDVFLEKFAELIVRECSNFLKDTLDDHFAAEQLEEHFGVEE